MLSYYAARLPAVEINSTFYRLPGRDLLERWRDQVPPGFRFAVKVSRRITHVKRLGDCAAEAERFFDAVTGLGGHLGPVLVQLPPQFRVDIERLEGFLALVPDGIRLAFEFRHPSWGEAAVVALLEHHGAAWASADEDGAPPRAFARTTSWTYLRLRAADYPVESLEAWRRACAGFHEAFVFFKHEAKGSAPALAGRMMSLHAMSQAARNQRSSRE